MLCLFRLVIGDKQLHVSLNMLPWPLPQVGGFLQRIDYVRKYAFGVMCILKDDKGQFPIRCAFSSCLCCYQCPHICCMQLMARHPSIVMADLQAVGMQDVYAHVLGAGLT